MGLFTTPSILINSLTSHFYFYQGLIQAARKIISIAIELIMCLLVQIVLINGGTKKQI